MGKMFILRGLPGCGKSTKARQLQKEYGGRIAERDIFRKLIYGTYYGADVDEKVITETQRAFVEEGLRFGENVIISDMNLKHAYVKAWVEIAWKHHAQIEIVDMTNVSLSDCRHNNANDDRVKDGKVVPDELIVDLHQRFIKGRGYPLPVMMTGAKVKDERRFETYVPDTSKRDAIIVDIDGTLARMVARGPFDEHLVHTDELIESVARMVEHAAFSDVKIIFMSGRTDGCEAQTLDWLREKMPWLDWAGADVEYQLIMRRSVEDRGRPDDIVKYELFQRHVAERYNVLYVIDDRNKVVNMWRAMGLTCAQVAQGDF
jgi:predicted kinase